MCEATAGLGVPVSVSVSVGSSCAFIVFDTADIDSAVDGVIEAAFKTKTDVSDTIKRRNITWAIFKTFHITSLSTSLLPPLSGPLGAVCAGESGGECGSPHQVTYGWVEMCHTVQ